MLLWGSQKKKTDEERVTNAVRAFNDSMADLQQRVEGLEKRWDEISYEWNDWYDKFRRLHARLARRESRAKEEAQNGPESPEDVLSQYRKTLLSRKLNRGQ